MVICTENIFGEEEGTFANPVAQLDRTTISINMLDPEDEADEMKITSGNVVGKKGCLFRLFVWSDHELLEQRSGSTADD